ncbi:hypothetical protein Patl1_27873 [Pistacia atlantica]|uniref:Uncharacterized protein n=1 Tax=Pistacia atlantica TaxID=434234 RepID=A0ACC1BGG4_9ROSI|nr:hypothetical protein Patl1_27873 [Pistacia atlantica]
MSTTEREYFWKVVSEKITVFTTNYKERIDPALLRPGRMDVHINLIGEVKVSPADVAGEFLTVKSSKNFLEDLVKFLETKESEERSSVEFVNSGHDLRLKILNQRSWKWGGCIRGWIRLEIQCD